MAYASSTTFLDGTVMHGWLLEETADELLAMCAREGLSLDCNARAESRRRELLAERLLMKRIFGKRTDLLHNADMMPMLDTDDTKLTVAHTRGYLYVALNCTHAIGIDVERYDRRVLNVRDGFLNAAEKAWLAPSDQVGHLVAWTAKEAIFKTIAVRNKVHNYRENIVLKPFQTPQLQSQLVHEGTFGEQVFYLETKLNREHLFTFACNKINV